MITGSAPIDQNVLEFIKICFCAPVVEAYGQTEGTGGEFSSVRYAADTGNVGAPSPCNEFVLRDVIDMKYLSTDLNEDGKIEPRGEICVRGSNVIQGYYKDEVKT